MVIENLKKQLSETKLVNKEVKETQEAREGQHAKLIAQMNKVKKLQNFQLKIREPYLLSTFLTDTSYD